MARTRKEKARPSSLFPSRSKRSMSRRRVRREARPKEKPMPIGKYPVFLGAATPSHPLTMVLSSKGGEVRRRGLSLRGAP